MTNENDVDTDEPASEQFDLEMGMTFDVQPGEIHEIASTLEASETINPDDIERNRLAAYVEACKRVADAAEDARKDVFEPALAESTEVGEQVGNVRKATGSRRYVTDDAGAFDAVLDAGHDPREVAAVKASALEDVLGADADEYLGETEYVYFRREE